MLFLRCTLLFLVFGLSIGLKRTENCIPNFEKHHRWFEPCKSNICYLIKDEPFFVEQNEAIPNGLPVACHNFTGASIKVLQKINNKVRRDYLCINVGKCSFNDMTRFLNDVESEDFKFMTGTPLFLLPERVTEGSSPSAGIFSVKLAIIGNEPDLSLPSAFEAATKALQIGSWMIVICVLIVFAIIRLLIAITFCSPPVNRENVFRTLWEYSITPEEENRWIFRSPNLNWSRNQLKLNHYNKILSLSIGTFFTLFWIFYGFSVSNFVFSTYPNAINLKHVGDRQLGNYLVLQDSGTETLLEYYLKKEHVPNPPWALAQNQRDQLARLEEKKGYKLITYHPMIRNYLNEQDKCQEVFFYDTKPDPSGVLATYYYGRGIDRKLRTAIDWAISDTVARAEIDEILYSEAVQKNCGRSIYSIYPQMLIVAVIIPVIAYSLLMYCFSPILSD